MVLFVCTGNTCRSVAAELLARKLWQTQGSGRAMMFASAGLSVLPGARAAGPLCSLLAEEGVDAEDHYATPLEEKQVHRAEVVLVMTQEHRRRLQELFPAMGGKIFLLKEYAGLSGASPEIEDPYGYPEKYRAMVEEIRWAVAKVVGKLTGREIPPAEDR